MPNDASPLRWIRAVLMEASDEREGNRRDQTMGPT